MFCVIKKTTTTTNPTTFKHNIPFWFMIHNYFSSFWLYPASSFYPIVMFKYSCLLGNTPDPVFGLSLLNLKQYHKLDKCFVPPCLITFDIWVTSDDGRCERRETVSLKGHQTDWACERDLLQLRYLVFGCVVMVVFHLLRTDAGHADLIVMHMS